MSLIERYDKILTGVVSGFILPVLTAFIMFLFSKGDPSIAEWITRVTEANITTHVITLSAFTNIIIFLVFNYFDMLKAARGVLGITIVWAILVFGIKFLL